MDSDKLLGLSIGVIFLAVMGLVVVAIMPAVLVGFGTASLSGANPAAITLWGLLGVIFVVAIIIAVLSVARGRTD